MSDIPPWAKGATRPTQEEIDRLVSPIDPVVVRAVRAATAPSEFEIGRIRPRVPRRRLSLAWLAIPALALVGLWGARAAMAPRPVEIAVSPKEDGLFLVRPGDVVEVARGVTASGDGVVRRVPGALRLDGTLHLAIASETAFELSSGRFDATVAEVDVDAGDGITVRGGEVVAPNGALLHAGDRWPPVAPVEAPPIAVVAVRQKPAPPPVVAPPAPAEPAAAPTPATPEDVVAWKGVLDALEAHPTDADRAKLLGGFTSAWPHSPFAPEARSLELLALARSGPPVQTLSAIEEALTAHPPRALELEAAAASIARDRLHDCGRAAPHDRVVAASGGTAGAQAEALLGLCAAGAGRRDEARATLLKVDQALLDPPLAAAVQSALEAP